MLAMACFWKGELVTKGHYSTLTNGRRSKFPRLGKEEIRTPPAAVHTSSRATHLAPSQEPQPWNRRLIHSMQPCCNQSHWHFDIATYGQYCSTGNWGRTDISNEFSRRSRRPLVRTPFTPYSPRITITITIIEVAPPS